MKLKPGDKLYRVVEYDLPSSGPHAWRVCETEITHISTKQLRLANPSKVGFFRIRFNPNIIGVHLHATKIEAIKTFIARCERDIESATRKINEVSRAIAWAKGQRDATSS